ncbi:MAG TPA: PAS domain S-box protein [SAR202 cluster bacterium]|nr:PAS domain S-box protein [SAR202 cluster bacterium]
MHRGDCRHKRGASSRMPQGGAADYLLKDRLVRLGPAVVNAIETIRAEKQRKLVGPALQESEALNRAIVENTHDGLVIVSDGKIVFANTPFLELCGLKHESEVIGQPEERFIHADDRELVKNKSMIRRSGAPIMYEYRVLAANNETRTVQASTSPINFLGRRATLRLLRDVTKTGPIDGASNAWETEAAQRAHEDGVLTEIGRIISS